MKGNYGIHISLTSASIAKMENGIPVILKSDSLKDRIPVCVYFNKRRTIQVGDAAYNAHKQKNIQNQKGWESTSENSFAEFTRTLGTDKLYHSINANKSFKSEELVAEIIKTLLSFEKDQDINSAVITIPDAFEINQIDAIRQAGKLAGLKQVEVVQESIAATLAYGLGSERKNGYWLVFDFGDGTFNATLLKVEEDKTKVIDIEGDNYLGGKNLDFAIIDEIILPYIQENFVIDSILADYTKKQNLCNALRFYAEDVKKKMSFNDIHDIITDLGDIPVEDDKGEEFELDITITQADITKALLPVFQKAIDISKSLLERNNLKGSSLDSLALIGGSTFSPVLRRMLKEQICKPDTSIDPKTIIVKGAALYASTIDVSEETSSVGDKTKTQHNTISINQVEDLLFELTENEILSSEEFKTYFEELLKLKKQPNDDKLLLILTELKTYSVEA